MTFDVLCNEEWLVQEAMKVFKLVRQRGTTLRWDLRLGGRNV